jgi:MFS family permease
MLGFAFTFQSLPPVLTLVAEELRLTHAEAGLLMSLFSLPTIFLGILAGVLSDRLGPFKIGVISLILMTLGALMFAVSGTLVYAGLGRVVAGVGAATISIVAAQTLSLWFRGREVGTAMGIYNTAMPVGTIVCFTTFGRLGESLGWRMPIFITATIGVVGLAAFLILYKPAPNPPPRITLEKEGLLSGLLKVGVPLWLVGFCWMWFNAAIISFSTFAPDFFVSKGYSIGFAGFLASLLMWGSLGLSPIIGRLMDKVGNNDLFIGAGGAILATAIYLVTRSSDFLFPMVVMAVAVAFIPAPVFASPLKVLKPKHLGLGFGILSAFSSIGVLFGPYVAGLVRDKTGSYETSFVFLSTLAVLVTVTAIILRIQMRKG